MFRPSASKIPILAVAEEVNSDVKVCTEEDSPTKKAQEAILKKTLIPVPQRRGEICVKS